MATAPTEYVHITRGATGKNYHTDPDCIHLDQAKNAYRRKRKPLEDGGWEECDDCAGEGSGTGSYDRSHLDALLDAAKEESA